MGCVEFTEADLSIGLAELPGKSGADAMAFEVARAHGVRLADMLGPSRYAALARARADLYRRLRQCGWSYPMIGSFVGGRDHTTVMAALGMLRRSPGTSQGPAVCRRCRFSEGAHVRRPLMRGVWSPLLCPTGGGQWEPGPRRPPPRISEALEEVRRANERRLREARRG